MPGAGDPELFILVKRYVTRDRRYLKLLHGNFTELPDPAQAKFIRHLRRDANKISDKHLRVLLSSEWRSQLTASWLISASGRAQFVHPIGDLLVASRLVYAGQGFSVALASIGGNTAASRLSEYLEVWLPQTDCRYDQDWAMAALVCLDSRARTDHSTRFLEPSGPWERWSRDPAMLAERVEDVEQLLQAIHT